MHELPPSPHTMLLALVLPVLITAGCTRDELPASTPVSAKAPVPSPSVRRSSDGRETRTTPTSTTPASAGAAAIEPRQATAQAQNEALDFEIEADPDIGRAPLTVQFAAVLDDESPGPVAYHWDFGDGSQEASNPVSHTYETPGQYTATLTVTTSEGQPATRDVTVQVDASDDDDAASY